MVTLEKVQCVGLINHLIEIPGDRGGVKMFDPLIDLDIFRELEEDIQPNREPVKKKVWKIPHLGGAPLIRRSPIFCVW